MVPEVHPVIAQLVALRRELGLTQTAVAKAIGVSKTCICELEKGHKEPKMRTFLSYAQLVGWQIPSIDLAKAVLDRAVPLIVAATRAKVAEEIEAYRIEYGITWETDAEIYCVLNDMRKLTRGKTTAPTDYIGEKP